MSASLKFGLFMPPFHAIGQNPTLAYERFFDSCREDPNILW